MSLPARRTIAQVLRDGERILREAETPSPRLDAEVLLAHTLDVDRAHFVAHDDAGVSPEACRRFDELIERRREGHPVAYLRGFREFYGLDFIVNPSVLVPRPETELLVDWGLELAAELARPLRIADIGTGSGCIAVALATQLPDARFEGVDICSDALAVAQENARRHGVAARTRFSTGDLLAPLEGRFDLIVTNPPYVAAGDPLLEAQVARHEPAKALLDPYDGDGLGFYRRLARESPRYLVSDGALLVEIGDHQSEQVESIFSETFHCPELRKDLAGIPRALLLRL